MTFNWNIAAWKDLMLPPRKRGKPRLGAYIIALLEGVQGAYDLFMAFRAAKLYELRWTSQTIWLERLLNDRFNNGGPAFTDFEARTGPIGIYVDVPDGYFELWFRWNADEMRHDVVRWNQVELDEDATRPRYRHSQSEVDVNTDFVVRVPLGLLDVEDPANRLTVARMRAWIERYRLAGNKYIIVNY